MKARKLFGLAALVFALGVTACGDNPDNPDTPEEPAHVCSPVSEWSSNGSKHWHACSDTTCKIKSDEAAHDLGEAVVVKPASCDEAGESKQTCKVCGYEKKGTIAKLTHVFVKDGDADKVTWTTEPGCDVDGVGTKHCTLCDKDIDYTESKLGHSYQQDAQGADIVTWTTPVGCENDGEGTKYCTRCKQNIAYTERQTGHSYLTDDAGAIVKTDVVAPQCETDGSHKQHCNNCGQDISFVDDKLGHKIVLNEGETGEAEAGKAKVRLYNCENGCGTTYFGFKATEASEASKPHLVFDEEGGAKFWGRPIGNAIALDENGNSSSDADHTPIFDKNETGDFFEYVFDLTQDQVNTIGKYSRLYCEAKAAGYLRNKDFWACESGGTEWTPGLYIDDNPDHLDMDKPIYDTEDPTKIVGYEGKQITDYRYVLYFNDQICEFDSRMKSPVTQADESNRKEFVLPYTFELKAGTNKISLRMSGGYKSTFYNFTFRPCDPEAEERFVGTGDKLGDALPVANKYVTSGAYELAAEDCDGVNAPKAGDKNTRLGKGGFTDTWDITGVPSGMYDIYIKGAYSSGNGDSYFSGAQNVANGKDAATGNTNNGNPYNPGARYTFTVDGGAGYDVESDKTYAGVGFSNSDSGSWTKVSLGSVGIPNGAKSLVLTNNNNGYSIWVFAVRLIRTGKYVAPPINVTFVDGAARVECENYTDCNLEKLPVVGESETSVSANPVGSSYSATVPTFTFTLNFSEAKHVKLVFRYKYTKVTSSGSTAKYVGQVKLDNAPIYSATGENQDFGLADLTENVPSGEWRTEDSVEFDVTAGQHTLTIKGPGRSAEADYDYIEFVEVVPQAQPQE